EGQLMANQCSPVMIPFNLGDCLDIGELGAQRCGTINRIEWQPNIRASQAGNMAARTTEMASWVSSFNSEGCAKFQINSDKKTASLPFVELDDPHDENSYYQIYYTLDPRNGANPQTGVCTVRLFGTHSDPNAGAQSLGCAVCVGSNCGTCQSP